MFNAKKSLFGLLTTICLLVSEKIRAFRTEIRPQTVTGGYSDFVQ